MWHFRDRAFERVGAACARVSHRFVARRLRYSQVDCRDGEPPGVLLVLDAWNRWNGFVQVVLSLDLYVFQYQIVAAGSAHAQGIPGVFDAHAGTRAMDKEIATL